MKDFDKTAVRQINDGELQKPLMFIKQNSEKLGMHDIADEADRILTNLRYMLKFFKLGTHDSTMPEMLAIIFNESYNLTTKLHIRLNNKTTNSGSLSSIKIDNEQTLFDAIVNNFPSTAEDRGFIQQCIFDDSLPVYLRAMIISALTLNLINFFENEKYESLYAYTLSDQPSVIRVRAWVGIILVTMAHDRRIATQPRLINQIKFICEEDSFSKEQIMMKIQTALLNCSEVTRACEAYHELFEINFNGIIKELQNQLMGESDKPLSLDDMTEGNLNSESVSKKTDIGNVMHTLMTLYNQGVDILYDSFKSNKLRGFYSSACNWFIPFSLDYPLVAKAMQSSKANKKYITSLSTSQSLCDTDKMSNIIEINSAGSNHVSFMADIIASITEPTEKGQRSVNAEITSYIHDLYRFFTIFKKDSGEFNPFDQNTYFGKYEGLSHAVNSYDTKIAIADMYINNLRYEYALTPLYEIVKNDPSKDNMKKYTICLKESSHVREFYLSTMATCFQKWPDDRWFVENYAKLLMEIRNYDLATEVLHSAETHFPNDLQFIMMLADCYINQKAYDKAMLQLFTAESVNKNDKTIMRTMAQCLFYMKNKVKAESCIAPLLKHEPQSIDWEYGGHIALLNDNIPLAIERYKHLTVKNSNHVIMLNYEKLKSVGISEDILTLTNEVLNSINEE